MTEPNTPLSTALIHHDYTPPAGFGAVPPGVHKASTVIFPNVAALRARDWRSKNGYTYGLHGTPTTFTLEERLATLEGGIHCVLAPSGLAAIVMTNVALLRRGDEVLLPNNAYGPSREMARTLLAEWGITHQLYDPMDVAGFVALIGERTRLAWLEAPGSITMEFPDLRALARAARQRGVLSALEAASRDRYVSADAIAAAYAAVGDTARVLDYLEKAAKEHAFTLVFLGNYPMFRAFHQNPRFRRIVDQIGVVLP